MEATHLEKTFSVDVGGYTCKLRALSVGAFESLNEGALNFVTAQAKEDIIISCLVEPLEIVALMQDGSIDAGIPLLLFDYILEYSGFSISTADRNAFMEKARNEIATNVMQSCKVMILAAGTLTLEQISSLSMIELLEAVAFAEQVLSIRQQNFAAALGGGQDLKLSWESSDPRVSELSRKHAEKEAEVEELLNMQTSARMGKGMRRL